MDSDKKLMYNFLKNDWVCGTGRRGRCDRGGGGAGTVIFLM